MDVDIHEITREIVEHASRIFVAASHKNNSIIFRESQAFGMLTDKFWDMLASQQFSEMITITNNAIDRLHKEWGPYSSWDAPTKKDMGFCLAWYHIFQAMAWGSLEKGELSVKHCEQALEVTDLPLHTRRFALDTKNQMEAIVEVEKTTVQPESLPSEANANVQKVYTFTETGNNLSDALKNASINGTNSNFFDYPAWRIILTSILGHTHPYFFDHIKTVIEQVLLPSPQIVTEYAESLEELQNVKYSEIISVFAIEKYFAIGELFLNKALQSGVLSAPGGDLLKSNDKQSKAYVSLAIRFLRIGRDAAEKLSPDDVSRTLIAIANDLLAQAYFTLYQLVWAHSSMGKAIRVLSRGVKVVPTHPELWERLGKAYELLTEENLASFYKQLNARENMSGRLVVSLSDLLPDWLAIIYLYIMRVLLFLIWKPIELVKSKVIVWSLHKKAAASYLKAQQLRQTTAAE